MKRISRSAIIAATLVLLGGTAVAQNKAAGQKQQPQQQSGLVDGTQPERILSIARGFGAAELSKDKQGDPKIDGRMGGTRYTVLFYGCKGGKGCRSIQFYAGFEVSNKPTLEALNAYNLKNRFSKVYADRDGDPAVEFDVNLEGGVSQKNLDDTFDWWKVIMANVRKAFVD